jgi:uncharacterized protein (TIGR03437 family)
LLSPNNDKVKAATPQYRIRARFHRLGFWHKPGERHLSCPIVAGGTGGTMATVNGVPAPLFFVSPTQINFLLPPAVELGAAQIVVSNATGSYALGTVEIVAAQPSLFTAPLK